MRNCLSYILVAALMLTAVSCSEHLDVEDRLEQENLVSFYANSSRLITRSGLQYSNFEENNRYLLFCHETSGNWDAPVMYDRQAFEDAGHLIDYGEDIFFNGRSLDFYGATLCSTEDFETAYPNNIVDSGSPVIALDLENYQTELPDLMYSNNLKGCTASQGVLEMDFIHALSRISVEVSKQNDSEELRYAKIKEIKVTGTRPSGKLKIVEGGWAYKDEDEPIERVFMPRSCGPVALSTVTQAVQDETGEDAHMLIFPNEDGGLVGLEVTYTLDEAGEVEVVKDCPVYMPGDTETAFLFEQNHKYVLSVVISNDGVLVVSVMPKVYDWIPETPDTYLGQPVTFGNLMWMDRNLGALSADYENDWYNTIGHYFQFGRNIPYILDVEKFQKYVGDGEYIANGKAGFNFATSVFVMKYRDRTNGTENDYHYDSYENADVTKLYYTRRINSLAKAGYERWPEGYKWTGHSSWDGLSEKQKTQLILNSVECIYTYDHRGEKVYGVKYVDPSSTTSVGDDVENAGHELVRNPDRIGAYSGLTDEQISELYKFGFGTKRPGSETTNLQKPTVWTFDNKCGAEYWTPGDSHDDPCPKGWRLPTKEDLNALMPTVQIDWATSGAYPQTKTTSTEDISFGTSGGHHVCYILKNKGTVNAYRLRIMSHYTNDGLNNKRYFSISRYGATAEDKDLSKYLSGSISASSKETTLWANPIETICYPACGFIVPDCDSTDVTVHPDLRSFGTGTVIRTADSNPTAMSGADGSTAQGFSYVQYLSTTDYQLSIQENSRRSLGDQIRCVRDINAKD